MNNVETTKTRRTVPMAKRNFGTKNSQSFLTEQKVRDIRTLAKLPKITHKAIAETYGIARRTVTDIVNFKRWPHVV